MAQIQQASGILSYAGVVLSQPTQEVIDWIERNISTADVFDFQRQSWPGKDLSFITFQGLGRERPIKLQTLWWPTGASRWAVGYFIATDSQLADIRKAVFPNGVYTVQPLKMYSVDQTQNIVDSIITNLWMLPARPLAQISGTNGLNLLTLVDDRYFWWMKSMGPISVTEGTTAWTDLYQAVVTALGFTLQYDGINLAYLKPPATLALAYEDLPVYLDAIAYNVGQRIIRNLDGTVHAWNVGTSQAQVATNLQNVNKRGGGKIVDLGAMVPSQVTLRFIKVDNNGPRADFYTVGVTLASLNIPTYANVTGFTGNKVWHDSGGADFRTGSISNSAELVGLTNRFSSDWYSYQSSFLDLKLNGVVNWMLEGISDSVEWTFRENEVSTRIQRPPWNDQTEELLHLSSVSTIPATTSLTVTNSVGLTVHNVNTIEIEEGLVLADEGGGEVSVGTNLAVSNWITSGTPHISTPTIQPCIVWYIDSISGLLVAAEGTDHAVISLRAATVGLAGGFLPGQQVVCSGEKIFGNTGNAPTITPGSGSSTFGGVNCAISVYGANPGGGQTQYSFLGGINGFQCYTQASNASTTSLGSFGFNIQTMSNGSVGMGFDVTEISGGIQAYSIGGTVGVLSGTIDADHSAVVAGGIVTSIASTPFKPKWGTF